MAVVKQDKKQVRASTSAPKKAASAKRPAIKTKKAAKQTSSAQKPTPPLKRASRVVEPLRAQVQQKGAVAAPVTLRKGVIPVAAKPSAQTCPLVLDGIVLVEDFSPRDCFSCDEFDCRFYAAEEGSGLLGSRLFAGGEAGDEEGEESDLFDFDRGEGDSDPWGDEDADE